MPTKSASGNTKPEADEDHLERLGSIDLSQVERASCSSLFECFSDPDFSLFGLPRQQRMYLTMTDLVCRTSQ